MSNETNRRWTRIRATAEAWIRNCDAGIPTGSGLDTRCLIADLLSLLDNQAKGVSTDMAVLSGYESGLADAATRMRDKCVRAVRAYLTDCRDEERGIIEAIALELESLTLDQVEQETK